MIIILGHLYGAVMQPYRYKGASLSLCFLFAYLLNVILIGFGAQFLKYFLCKIFVTESTCCLKYLLFQGLECYIE